MRSKKEAPEGKFISSVKVGPKGQIVIPKEIRDMFDIHPGESLVLLADVNQGIAMHKMNFFMKVADSIFNRKKSGEDCAQEELIFAEALSNIDEQEEEE